MFEAGTAVGTIQPYFLTQAVPDLDGSVPLAQQQELPAIEGQALDVAQVLASFIGEATTGLDIASDDLAAQYATYIDGLVQRYRG